MKNIHKFTIRKFKNIQAFTPVLVVGLLITAGAVIYNFNARAANAGFSFTSDATMYKVGDTFDVQVYENSQSDCANVVEAHFTYPANLLRFNSYSASGSKFDASLPSNNTSGKVSIAQYTTRKECGQGGAATSGVSGKQLIGTASFTVLAAGSAPLNFLDSSIAVSAADNKSDVAPAGTSRSFTLTSAAETDKNPNKPDRDNQQPGSSSGNSPKKPTAVTSVTNVGSDDSIPLTDNDSLEITQAVGIQPMPVQPDGVKKIEYFLSGKLVATVIAPPYKYTLDSTKYLNGTYTLTTKTYYDNGQTKSVSQKIIINNPFGIDQVRLWSQKYAWLIILVLLVIGAGVAAWIIHRRGGSDDFYGDGTFEKVGDTGPVAPPSPDGPQVYKPTGKV